MKSKNHRQMSIERLEARAMMTASANLANHILTVQGTDHNDSIVISNILTVGSGSQKIQVIVKDLETGEVLQKQFNAADINKIVVHGFGGDDFIQNATAKPSEMYGDFGNDTLYGGSGADKLYAASSEGGADIGSHNYLYGNGGDDKLYGSSIDDDLHGGDGNDYLYGGLGADELWGDAGNDHLYGKDVAGGADGQNILHGGAGNDYLMGADNVDKIFGDAGDDEIHGAGGDDFLVGGTTTADGNHPTADSKTVLANSGNDTIYGGDGNDTIFGGDGKDRLHGNDGNDLLYGGDGDDFLAGGPGSDLMDDRSGHNTFYFDLLDVVIYSDSSSFSGWDHYWWAPKVVEGGYKGYAVFTG